MYLCQLAQVAFGSSCRIESIQSMGEARLGVDFTTLVNCQYQFPYGDADHKGFLQFYLTGQANTEERACIQGTDGRIVVESPSHIPQRVRLERDSGRTGSISHDEKNTDEQFDFALPDDSFTTWNHPGSIGFTYQIQAVGEALRQGKTECPDFTWHDSLQVAYVLDQIREQVKTW